MSHVHFYPLRPELAESTYLLYQATQHPFYLHVGKDIINSIQKHAKARYINTILTLEICESLCRCVKCNGKKGLLVI